MFKLAKEPLDVSALRDQLQSRSCGALCSFEGVVRDHNDGLAVQRLEYEAYEQLAIAEGNKIISEARERFAIEDCLCVHRVGMLEVTDVAVWVGAIAAHRDAAFAASRFVIDEIKRRLPIWKREHYSGAEPQWVNCAHGATDAVAVQRCASHLHYDDEPVISFDRQTILPEIGVSGQKALAEAKVLVVGCGGLGSAASLYLAAAGVGLLGLCDGDSVDSTNIHRQILFGRHDVGQPKAALAAQRLMERYGCKTSVIGERLNADNARLIVESFDLVVDCTDDFSAKFLLNDVCLALGKTLIHASVYQFEGQLAAVMPDGRGQCLRCLWPETPESGCVATCSESGILGATVGVFGSLQAAEAIKIICGQMSELASSLILFDLKSMNSRKIKIKRRKDCAACAGVIQPVRWTVMNEREHFELDILELSSAELKRFQIIDIREPGEDTARILRSLLGPDVREMPMSSLEQSVESLDKNVAYLFICQRGRRSARVVELLREKGFNQVFSLKDGVEAVRRKFIA